MEMTGDSLLASGAGEGDYQQPSAVPASTPESHAARAQLSRGTSVLRSQGRGDAAPVGGRLQGEGLPYTHPHRDGEDCPCSPAPSSIPGCGCWHGGSPLTPGCRCLASPFIPAYRCSSCPLTLGCRCPSAPQGADPCNARGFWYPGYPGCRCPGPCVTDLTVLAAPRDASAAGPRDVGACSAPGCRCRGSPPRPGMPLPSSPPAPGAGAAVPALPVPAAPR